MSDFPSDVKEESKKERKQKSKYVQEIPQSLTADQSTAS